MSYKYVVEYTLNGSSQGHTTHVVVDRTSDIEKALAEKLDVPADRLKVHDYYLQETPRAPLGGRWSSTFIPKGKF